MLTFPTHEEYPRTGSNRDGVRLKQILTPRQNEALEFIRSFLHRYNRPPTLKEIAGAMDVRSTNAVSKLLHSLEQKGYLRREQHAARGIELLDGDRDALDARSHVPALPVIGRVHSSEPERLRRRSGGFMYVDPSFMRGTHDPDDCLIGRAGDDGMKGNGIQKGDFVIIREMSGESLRDGDVAAVLIRDELLVRLLFHAHNRLHLRPADQSFAARIFTPNDPDCHVIGRVIGVMRRL